ncbi:MULTISPECIES: hypothetical protein [unclassified Mesorhizobium]|uniref:hypothetical protein n=1 Tax=unclassified Mesorhizobium TaxID=325217 RepID=UPI000FDB0844|nr:MULTISPECIES: hypothetical protein [unclassified Mesorhizobium]TGR39573.1 hypothetical protein EN842_40790 [bacterium M00.F.Ca.ET.199.01.1.1]TGU29010.1 hypothetical protein EN799_35965 [bacterium M00.F.Ca.ET.156.01.1.1]TGV84287.1 hypothetical protein EN792_021525 [Mesorhizobium sp. M00.F.Ca.ET.149.01.1.1]TGR22400.1 hypothetical protein EN845_22105 [Mesorhizobium sp. M8A.F.Ca.ET.202.01.1.1]TGR23881.1 hypothetical protein EN840_20750 [Mesorhizobium sp. M8A.F.Ca.ET.197.01.1.1]
MKNHKQIRTKRQTPCGAALEGKNRAALNALNEVTAIHGFRQFGVEWPGCDVVLVSQWRQQFYAHCIGNAPEAKKKAFQRAREALQAVGLVAIHDEHAWRCPDSPGKNGAQGYLKDGA